MKLLKKTKEEISLLEYFKKNISLYLMVIPGLLSLILFTYVPMYGNVIAFQKYSAMKGILGSDWVGFDNFIKFFNSPFFERLLGNTVILGVFTVIFTFPAPIILALMLNEVKHEKFKKVTQTISYMPYFISVVIVIGLLKELTSYNDGAINDFLVLLGFKKINFFTEPQWFRPLYIVSSIWTGIGYNSIIYLAAISGVNPELYESAVLDGASRWKQALYITLPSIAPTIVILFILNAGSIVSSDYAKILLMYSPLTYETADVISTYVYREGILGGSYSYTTAINLFTSIIGLLVVLVTNYISKKVSETALF